MSRKRMAIGRTKAGTRGGRRRPVEALAIHRRPRQARARGSLHRLGPDGRPVATLVAAVDFSKASRAAFDAAVTLAEDLGARLVLVHAFAPVPKGGARDPIGQAKAEIDAA